MVTFHSLVLANWPVQKISGTMTTCGIVCSFREPWRREWLTEEGFVYPGIPSARQCNEHSKKLPPARLQELAQVGISMYMWVWSGKGYK